MKFEEMIKNNKGIVSSEMSKNIAQEILAGKSGLLKDSFELIYHKEKNIRATCAKIIEIIAEKEPELIAGNLEFLYKVFEFPEPQTRWSILYVFGLCASINPNTARKAFWLMDKYISKESGTCLLGRSIDYLGYIGSLSVTDAEKSIIFLEKASKIDENLLKRVLISYERLSGLNDQKIKNTIKHNLEKYTRSNNATLKKLAVKIINN